MYTGLRFERFGGLGCLECIGFRFKGLWTQRLILAPGALGPKGSYMLNSKPTV